MRIAASIVALAVITLAVFGAPLLRSQPVKEIELDCRPPLSLLRWWDLERVAQEEKPATIHARYVCQGEVIATRQQLGQLRPGDSEPWVTWRGPGASGKLQISVSLPGRVSAVNYARWQEWVRQCEAPQEVEFQVTAPSSSATSDFRSTPTR